MFSLLDLPVELQDQVLDVVVEDATKQWACVKYLNSAPHVKLCTDASSQALLNLSRTCKALHARLSPALYRNVGFWFDNTIYHDTLELPDPDGEDPSPGLFVPPYLQFRHMRDVTISLYIDGDFAPSLEAMMGLLNWGRDLDRLGIVFLMAGSQESVDRFKDSIRPIWLRIEVRCPISYGDHYHNWDGYSNEVLNFIDYLEWERERLLFDDTMTRDEIYERTSLYYQSFSEPEVKGVSYYCDGMPRYAYEGPYSTRYRRRFRTRDGGWDETRFVDQDFQSDARPMPRSRIPRPCKKPDEEAKGR